MCKISGTIFQSPKTISNIYRLKVSYHKRETYTWEYNERNSVHTEGTQTSHHSYAWKQFHNAYYSITNIRFQLESQLELAKVGKLRNNPSSTMHRFSSISKNRRKSCGDSVQGTGTILCTFWKKKNILKKRPLTSPSHLNAVRK